MESSNYLMSAKCTNNLVFCICWEQEMELEKLKEQTSGQTMIQNIIMLLTLFLGKICHSDQQSCFLHLLGLFLSSSSSMSALPAQVKQSCNNRQVQVWWNGIQPFCPNTSVFSMKMLPLSSQSCLGCQPSGWPSENQQQVQVLQSLLLTHLHR